MALQRGPCQRDDREHPVHGDPVVAAAGLLLSIAIGVLGGLPPALRAARLGVVQAIRHA